jgi:hypothetical protein
MAVVFVGFAVAILPGVELARADADPTHELSGGDAGAFVVVPDVVDDLVAGVMGNPASF